MAQIPRPLIASLMGLGFLESEAKIYTAIVLLHRAEVKDLLDFLDLSKPSIYTGMRSLEERGLIMLTSSKPTTYQAIPPEIALDLIMAQQRNHKEKALHLIHSLEIEYARDYPQPALWSAIKSDGIPAKIKDMLEHAREKVYCGTAGKYLGLLEGKARSNLNFQIMVLSKDNTIQKRLELVFNKNRADIQTIKKSKVLNLIADMEAEDRPQRKESVVEALNALDFDHTFVLIVDDTECLYIPPLPDGSLNAMTTMNRAMILNIKLMMRTMMTSGS